MLLLLTKIFKRIAYIGPNRARVFCEGQPLQKVDMIRTNCYSIEHFRSKCTSPSVCKMCRMPGHKQRDAACDAPSSIAHKKMSLSE